MAQKPAPAYHFELIIFKYKNANTQELEKVIDPKLNHRLEQPALNLYDTKPDDAVTLVTNPRRFKLTEELQKMEDSDLFEILDHIAWQQPPYQRNRARYINIAEDSSKGLLVGIAWASYERYFQLRLDLQYDSGHQNTRQTLKRPQNQAPMVAIHMKKIMDMNKLYYIDHPLIGVLAYVHPLKEDSDEMLMAPRALPMMEASTATDVTEMSSQESASTASETVIIEEVTETIAP